MKKYANRYYYTDIDPYEVLEVINEKTLLVREMKAEIKEDSKNELNKSFVRGGFLGNFDNSLQRWNIISDESKTAIKVRLHKDGYYHAAGDKGTKFKLSDKPIKRYDYNF